MTLAQDLLEQAAHLASREKGKPKQASLRRAISAAYCSELVLFIPLMEQTSMLHNITFSWSDTGYHIWADSAELEYVLPSPVYEIPSALKHTASVAR